MATRNIRIFGDNLLRKISKPVEKVDNKLIMLLDDMYDTLKKYNGVGLAAPQVGVLKRVAIIDIPIMEDEMAEAETEESGFYELINPVIIETEGEIEENEGCLSLPGKNAPVLRPRRVKVRAMDRKGAEFEINGTGIMAKALCHEIDHLDGILFVDKATGELQDNDQDHEE